MYFLLMEKIKLIPNCHLLTKTWKYDGSVLGTEVAGEAQTDNPLIGLFSGLIAIAFS